MKPPHARELADRIHRRLQRDRNELLDFAAELIRIPSENPPGNAYAACAALIAERLTALDLDVGIVDPSGAGPCVFGVYGDAGPTLYFSGHYDVVPAQAATQFEPVLRNGDLHGRGAADMKGGIAAMAFAARALAASGFEPRGRLVCVSVPDEETSGPRGTVALAAADLIQRDAVGMLTMEPTGDVVWNANRGVITLRVTVHGKPAHVGLHFRGVNAFRGMLTVAQLFAKLEGRVSRRRTRFRIEPEAARRSVLLLGGELDGGRNFNVVPDRVSFTVDRRPNPEEDFDAERAALLAVVEEARAQGVRCDVAILQEGRSGATDPGLPLGRALASGIRTVTGRSARFELCPGVLETRHYAALDIPALAYGPGRLSVSHGPDEHVSVDRLLQCAEVYALTAMRLLA